MIGLTTGTFNRHLASEPQPDKLVLLDLPKIMRDELDLRILDLMTANLPTLDTKYLEKLRSRAEQANCIITNLKLNQPGLDMGSADLETRQHAISVYKSSIDAAEVLGCRWVRPLPTALRPDFDSYVDSYRRLIEYAAPKGISLLIENFGWIQEDPAAIPKVVESCGSGLDACADTGNWNDEVRYTGLTNAFPLSVTCDFKVFELDNLGQHARYDLERCFQIGWDAGFRGPWCFEHFNQDLQQLWVEIAQLRNLIRKWSHSNTPS
jgi:hypothetical protein